MIQFRWPCSLLITILLAVLSGSAVAAQSRIAAESGIAATEIYVTEKINGIRADHGLAPLRVTGKLRTAARRQSTDMAANDFLAHVDSQGNDLQVRLARAGATEWRTIGENVGQSMGYRNNSDVIIAGWMKSPHHRDNILSSDYDSTGIGAAIAADGTLYLTQVFMGSAKNNVITAECPYKSTRTSRPKKTD